MPPKSSSRKGVKKGTPKTDPSTGTQTPSEYWNQFRDVQQAFLDGATQETDPNLDTFGAEIKTEMPSPTPASVTNGENESEYSVALTPAPGPISVSFPCTEDDLTLCHASTTDTTGYPIFVSRNGLWDWYYLASNNNTTESSATPANDTTNGNSKNIKSESADGLSLSPNQFPCSEDDIKLSACPNPSANPANTPTFSSQNGRWEWIFLPSNTDTESPPPRVKMEDIPEANPRTQRPSNPLSTTFSAADLNHFAFPYGIPDSDSDISSVPSLVENIAEQARTAKHVRFFMNTSHDKHFVSIEVAPLIGNSNWQSWLAAMRLLFRQHSVWPIVTGELQPLSPGHNLYMWYQRMRDCAIALIYTNVSEEVRRTTCFISTVREDDPDILMSHLYAHYASPDSDHNHEESELD